MRPDTILRTTRSEWVVLAIPIFYFYSQNDAKRVSRPSNSCLLLLFAERREASKSSWQFLFIRRTKRSKISVWAIPVFFFFAERKRSQVKRPGNSYICRTIAKLSKASWQFAERSETSEASWQIRIIFYIFKVRTPHNSKPVFLFSTSSSTSRPKNMDARGFLLLFFFPKKISDTIYRFSEERFL